MFRPVCVFDVEWEYAPVASFLDKAARAAFGVDAQAVEQEVVAWVDVADAGIAVHGFGKVALEDFFAHAPLFALRAVDDDGFGKADVSGLLLAASIGVAASNLSGQTRNPHEVFLNVGIASYFMAQTWRLRHRDAKDW